MIVQGDYIKADEGKTLRRKVSGEIFGKEMSLGYSYYIGGVLQNPPHRDIPEDFEEIDIVTKEVVIPVFEHAFIKDLPDNYVLLEADEDYRIKDTYTEVISPAVTARKDDLSRYEVIKNSQEDLAILNKLRNNKIAEIRDYASSSMINSFEYNGLDMWITDEERAGYLLTIAGLKRQKEKEITFKGITLTLTRATTLLDKLNKYVLDCKNITEKHIANINSLNTEEEIEQYDYKSDYPGKIKY